MSAVYIRIAGKNKFPCPVGWAVGKAEARIRLGYRLDGGFLTKNGIAMDFDDPITADGEYQFINFQEHQGAGILYSLFA